MLIKAPKLRPHHILCMHAFTGMGYSDSFVNNMTDVIEEIKEYGLLEIVFSVDDICIECPHLVDSCKCYTEDKVLKIDRRVIDAFNLEQRVYKYSEIVLKLKLLNEKLHRSICKKCSWYNSGSCFKKIKEHIN